MKSLHVQNEMMENELFLDIWEYIWDYFLSIQTYDECPKISYTIESDKMEYANNAEYASSADLRSSLVRVCTVCRFTKYFKKQLH